MSHEELTPETARTDWQNMTTDERQAIADDIAMRETLRIAREREERKRRAIALVNESRIWDIPMLHQFICKINALAKKHGCLYGQAFLQIANEHRSLKCTFLNLLRLLKLRFKDKFQK